MNQLQTLAAEISWATKNLAYNLDFIPDDKLDWKPAPTALSALEVVGHLLTAIDYFKGSIENAGPGAVPEGDGPTPTSRDEAKSKLIAAGEDYSRMLLALTPEEAERKVELSFGSYPLSFVASMAVTDSVHHHGQIAYIQTLLGDTESHFDFSLLPQ